MFGRSPYTYAAYGLRIKSAIKLPGFVETEIAGDSMADAEIIRREISKRDLETYFGAADTFKALDCDVRVAENAMCFAYPKTGTILVTDGNRIAVDLKAGAHEEDVLPYLTGYVLAVLLHQRNFLVLHASVVLLNDIGVAFLGAKGQGKSTLAASLQVSGGRLISDDLLPLVFEKDRVFALPGYPQIKLFEDSVTAVGEVPSRLPAVHRNSTKYSFSCEEFSDESVPLFAVYVLNIHEEISFAKISMPESFIEATKHTHVSYYLRESGSSEWHFEKCKKLVQSVPFFRLSRPYDFERIYQVADALKTHVGDVVLDRGRAARVDF